MAENPVVETDSIFDSIKLMLGMESDYNAFDTDLIIHINSAIAKLTQVGVGDPEGFELDKVNPSTSKWQDFIGEGHTKIINMVQTYVYLQVRLLFDPPQNSFTQDVLKKEMEEQLWRINVEVDTWSKPSED